MRDPQTELEELRRTDLFRELRKAAWHSATQVEIDDTLLLPFCSNDYLGLSYHPTLAEAAIRATKDHGVGSGASRLISGSHPPHIQLEETLANFKQRKRALAFSTGYATAIGTIGALVGKGDIIILDKLCHASLIDGARLSGATIRVFRHNDLDQLEARLAWAQKQTSPTSQSSRILVVTESVFSMDGDCAPLASIAKLKDQYGALLLIDEAHAFGVVGPRGRGLCAELSPTEPRPDIEMGTLSKAAGCAGGYVAADGAWIDLITNQARSLIYSTAPPPSQAASASAAIEIIGSKEGDTLRSTLQNHISRLASTLDAGQEEQFSTPIFPFILGGEAEALAAANQLFSDGLYVLAIRYPTVARGSARLRITLSAAHESCHIESLITHLGGLAEELPPHSLS